MDLTRSLMQQPELMEHLAQWAMVPALYGFVLTVAVVYGAVMGFAKVRVMGLFLNPMTILGSLLFAASAVAPVPLSLGLGCFGIWYAWTAGAILASTSVGVWLNGPILRRVAIRRRFGRSVPLVLLATATGRARAGMFATYAAPLGAILWLADSPALSWLILLLSALALSLQARIMRRAIWAFLRREYRMWAGTARAS